MKAEDWLPVEALDAGLRARLDGVVAEWLRHWVSEPETLSCAIEPPGRMGDLHEVAETFDGLTSLATPAGEARLLSWALAIPVSELLMAGQDGRILESMKRSLFEDLARRLKSQFGLDKAHGQGPLVDLAVRDDRSSLLFTVALPAGALARLAKTAMKPAPTAAALHRISDTLTATPVVVEAFVGKCELSLDELGSLAPGDILRLDRMLSEAMELRLGGSMRTLGHARVAEREQGIALELC